MVVRLSELLERIRPAGTPGAATESALRSATDEEIAAVANVLGSFDEEVDHAIDVAQQRAAAVVADAERRARRIKGELPDRLAVASGESSGRFDSREEAECQRIATEAAEVVERRRRRAAAVRDDWADRIVASICSAVEEAGRGG